MKNWIAFLLVFASSAYFAQQTVKSKALKIKYTLPAGWTAEEFGGKSSWDEPGNALCKCSGVIFTRQHKDGKMNVVIYPSTQSGLDSSKRNYVGSLRFENVEKYDKIKNKHFSFEKRRSNFTDTKTNKKSFDVIRYFTKVEDHYYILYAWQENLQSLDATNEKELYAMVNAIEPL